MKYVIYKTGIEVESSMAQVKLDYMKKRVKQLNGNTLHIINGDVIDVYHNKNNRVTFSHTFVREEK